MAEAQQITQNVVEGLSSLLQKVLGAGLVLNGGLKIDQLTVTTTDKAKELGLLPYSSQQEQKQSSSQSQQSEESQEKSSESSNGQKQQQEAKGQVTRQEFDSLMEEIKYMRSLLQNPDQDSSKQKSKPQGKQ